MQLNGSNNSRFRPPTHVAFGLRTINLPTQNLLRKEADKSYGVPNGITGKHMGV